MFFMGEMWVIQESELRIFGLRRQGWDFNKERICEIRD